MTSKTKAVRGFFIGALWIFLMGTATLSSAQEANISLPAGYLNEPYSESIADTLRNTYRVTLRTSSKVPLFEWRAIGPFPKGLGIDPGSGIVFGTPTLAPQKPYRFRVQVLDRSLPNPAPLNLLVSLTILRKPVGEAPVLAPLDSPVEPDRPQKPAQTPARDIDSQVSQETFETIEPIGVVTDAPLENKEPCDEIIDEPTRDDPDDALIIIDANTGKILEGATRVKENARVKVVFVNKNPFKYDYSFELIPKDVGNAVVISFLGLIPGIPAISGILPGTIERANLPEDEKKVDDNADQAREDKRRGRAMTVGECDPTFVTNVDTAVKNSERIAKALSEAALLIKTVNEEYAAFVKATDTIFKSGNRRERMNFSKKLCESGMKVLPKLKALSDFDFDDFSKSLKIDLFSAHVTVLEGDLEKSGCDDEKKNLYKKVIAALKQDVTIYKTKLEELKKSTADSKKSLEAPTKIVRAALSSGSFAEAAYAPSLGDATSVSVMITRKNVREENPKEEKIAVSPPIEIGQPRVVLSGGLGFSSINERNIVRQQSLVPDSSGTMVLGNRFGFENRSQFRPSGLVQINGLLKEFSLFGERATFALSGGLVFSNRNEGLATEFIAGPSLGFANNRMFLTFGFHAARVDDLSGEFKIGDPVPDGLTEVPIQKNWRNGLMIGLTFKIQPQ